MARYSPKIEAIDLYCGAGGLTCGLQRADIKVLAGIDTDNQCKFAFESNNNSTFIKKDVTDVRGAELKKLFSTGSIKLLAGCAPCQPFSTYRKSADATAHAKWGLLSEFERLVLELEPDIVTMENVPQLSQHQPFKDFLATLQEMKYETTWKVVNCADYGVPQHRKRLVLLASRLGAIDLPGKTSGSWVTVREAIGELPHIKAGVPDATDALHRSATLTPLNLKRIKASTAGGSWSEWPKELVAKCHTKKNGKTFRSVYGRMAWDEPAPTMTTLCFGFGNGRFGHPKQDRAISLREAAIFQSFPKDYRFIEDETEISFKGVGRMIGNAVPPGLGAAIGRAVLAHVSASAEQSTKPL
jgi:DNA (cytosine-5)-methyltransferase 1